MRCLVEAQQRSGLLLQAGLVGEVNAGQFGKAELFFRREFPGRSSSMVWLKVCAALRSSAGAGFSNFSSTLAALT